MHKNIKTAKKHFKNMFFNFYKNHKNFLHLCFTSNSKHDINKIELHNR